MSYRPGGGMTPGRSLILAGWTALMLGVTGAFLFFFAYGDCFEGAVCKAATNRSFAIIGLLGGLTYWSGFAALVRYGSRH